MKVAHQATRRRTFTLQLIDRPEPHQHLCLQCDAFEECSNPAAPISSNLPPISDSITVTEDLVIFDKEDSQGRPG